MRLCSFALPQLWTLRTANKVLGNNWYIGLSEVHYFTDSHSLPASFFELVDKSKEVIDAVLRRQDFDPTQLFTPFVTSAVSIKHRGFAEEREVRIVAMAATKLTDDKMKGTPGYVSLPIKYIFTCERDARKKAPYRAVRARTLKASRCQSHRRPGPRPKAERDHSHMKQWAKVSKFFCPRHR